MCDLTLERKSWDKGGCWHTRGGVSTPCVGTVEEVLAQVLARSFVRSCTLDAGWLGARRGPTGLLPEAPRRIIRVWGRHRGPISALSGEYLPRGCVRWIWNDQTSGTTRFSYFV